MLGVLGAMKPEVEAIHAAMDHTFIVTHLGYEIIVGNLDSARIALVQCGVGKVNAALATAAITLAGAREIVFVGVAGGIAPGVGVGDLVIAHDLVQHDVDATSMGLAPGQLLDEPVEWAADATLTRRLADAAATLDTTVHTGRIASGDQFITDTTHAKHIYDTFGALAVEMEGAAVAQTAARLGIFVAIARWISDSADEGAVSDFPAFLARAAALDLNLIRALTSQTACVTRPKHS